MSYNDYGRENNILEKYGNDGINDLGKLNVKNTYDSKIIDDNLKRMTDINLKIEYYEVLTDGQGYWVSSEDIAKICSGFSDEQLAVFNLNNDKLFGKSYVSVTRDFLIFIANNTYDPKYLAKLALLKVADGPFHNYDNTTIDELMKYVQTVDGTTEIEYETKMTR